MKTLQNDLTTIEQSKRLLELGVSKNSANHYYGKDGKIHYIDGTIPYSLLWETECISCWSVGRLIEIIDKCEIQTEAYQNVEMHEDCTSQGLIDILKCETDRKFDFSKLN